MSAENKDCNTNQDQVWALNLARALITRSADGSPLKITWLNHYSAVQTIDSGVHLGSFDYVGLDGTLLRMMLGRDLPRTSADLTIPLLLDRMGPCRVGIVGSRSASLLSAVEMIKTKWPRAEVLWTRDGFENLPSPFQVASDLPQVDLLIVGLGAPLQDEYVAGIPRTAGSPRIILTCGGWIDQIGSVNYYPSWAYPLRLNWMIRLVREPRRLWRRYSLDAASAWRRRSDLRKEIVDTPGLFNAANASRESTSA